MERSDQEVSSGKRWRVLSAYLLVTTFGLALVFGAQTEAWSWGPALITLGSSLICAAMGGGGSSRFSFVGLAIGGAVVWIVIRGVMGEVADGARADALLAFALAACCWIVFRIGADRRAVLRLIAGVAMVCLVNELMAVCQRGDPSFVWPYPHKPSAAPTGFFGHYNYFANFTAAVSLFCLVRCILVKDSLALRLLLGVVFLLGVFTVVTSGSRGGAVSLGAGMFAVIGGLGAVGWRKKSRWGTVALLLVPLLMVGMLFGGWALLQRTVEHRAGNSSAVVELDKIADNSGRLQWLGLANSVALENPLFGGGSRSYAWKRNQYWDVRELSRGTHADFFVHNEPMQLFAEYGFIGVFFVVLALLGGGWCIVYTLLLGNSRGSNYADSVAVGCLASLVALLIHSNVSFVFHLLPSVLLLGLILGFCLVLPGLVTEEDESTKRFGILGLFLAIPILWFGMAGTVTLRLVWPVLYGDRVHGRVSAEEEVHRLEAASGWWPGSRLAEEQGRVARMEAVKAGVSVNESVAWNTRAVESYRKAASAHPFHPGFQVNLGNILSDLQRDEEAEEAFERAIELQGGLESGYRSRLCLAQHIYTKWYRIWQAERRAGEALHEFLRARKLLDESDEQSLWGYDDSKEVRKNLEEVIKFLEGGKVVPVPPRLD